MTQPTLETQDFFLYYKPSRCARRLYLFQHPLPDGSDNEQYLQLSQEADAHHVRRHLKQHKQVHNHSKMSLEQSQAELLAAFESENDAVFYRPSYAMEYELNGQKVTLKAQPDFVVFTPNEVIVRQCKMGKRITRDNHPDTMYGLQYHGWILEHLLDADCYLEVFNTQGRLLEIAPAKDEHMYRRLDQLLSYKTAEEEPYVPISWTRCQDCLFKTYCWDKAEKNQDISLLPNLEKSLLLSLRAQGILSVPELLERMDTQTLANYEWYQGKNTQHLGEEKAHMILQMARSLQTGKPILTQRPELPQSKHWIMFDIEGVPAQPKHPERIYLWGLFLMGDTTENLQLISRQFSRHADKHHWFDFLETSEKLFDTYGDIPFVHWGNYEPQSIQMYIDRYGDYNKVAQRILSNLLDFWLLLKDSVIIPLPSYSLKVLEQYVGFERPDKDYGGYWSVLNYLKSTSTRNKDRRRQIQDQLLDYNRADLEAMWHIIEWFQAFLENEA